MGWSNISLGSCRAERLQRELVRDAVGVDQRAVIMVTSGGIFQCIGANDCKHVQNVLCAAKSTC